MKKLLLLMYLLLSAAVLWAQKTVTGKVTDENNNPVFNASVTVKETQKGTTTDVNGNFSIATDNKAKTLVFSYVGKAPEEISIGSQAIINITLKQQQGTLNDVVVVGYGSQKRGTLTGSVSTVKAKDIENRPYASVDQELQGKIAGLQAPMTTGQPGAAQSIRIRGIGSSTAGGNPLYVVDGIIINSGDLSDLTTTANALAGLNPNDIESVSVLKDAQATSIYGSRGANGVIVITTKTGRPGKTKFRADIEIGMNKMANLPPNARFLDADEYIALLREGVLNAGLTQADADYYAQLYGEGNGVNTNWTNVITRTGNQQTYNLSASGGDTKNQFYVSGGYYKQEATVIKSDFTRRSFRANFKHVASDKLNFTVNLNGSNSIQNSPKVGGAYSAPVGTLPFLRPTLDPYNADGSLNTSGYDGNYNPVYIAENDKNITNTTLIQAIAGAEYAIIPSLKFTSRLSVDYNLIEENQFWNQFHGDGAGYGGLLQTASIRYFNWIYTNQLDYSSNIGVSDLRLDAKLGYEVQKNKYYQVSAAAQGYPPTNRLYFSVNAATPVVAGTEGSDFDFAGLYSAVNFTYQNKYILSGSVRRDGSSRFSENNRFGNFWSAGAAWNINKEKFFSKVSFVSELKLRGSYGTSGNAAIGDYQWRGTISYGDSYSGQPGGTFGTVGNANLTWESTKQGNIGLEAGFFKDRITLIADVYKKISDRLLLNNPLSLTTGFTAFIDNIGKMQNTGYEITLNTVPVKTKDFTWEVNFNLTHNKNKIVKLPGGKDVASSQFLLREGYDYRSYYVREWAGVDPANGDPLWYIDGTHNQTTNNYNAAQRQLIGSSSPKYYGGLSTLLSYKGFEVQADLVYNYGNLVLDGWVDYAMDGSYFDLNKYALNLQRWQKPGDITNVPKYEAGSSNNSSSISSRFLNKGDYIRLRNFTVGYTLANSLLSKLHITGLRFYVRGTNLWTKTYDKNLTIDPEQGINGASNLNIFYTKSLTAGLNLSF